MVCIGLHLYIALSRNFVSVYAGASCSITHRQFAPTLQASYFLSLATQIRSTHFSWSHHNAKLNKQKSNALNLPLNMHY